MGSKAVKRVVKWAKAKKARRVCTFMSARNAAMLELCKGLGFEHEFVQSCKRV